MAVYLDRKMGGRGDLARTPIAFTTTAIYRTSALDPTLLTALRSTAGLATVSDEIRQVWYNKGTPREKADAIVALVALGEDMTAELETMFNNPIRREDAKTRPHPSEPGGQFVDRRGIPQPVRRSCRTWQNSMNPIHSCGPTSSMLYSGNW